MCEVAVLPPGYVAFDSMHYSERVRAEGLTVLVSLWDKPVFASVVPSLRSALAGRCREYTSKSPALKVRTTPLTLTGPGAERAVAWKSEDGTDGEPDLRRSVWFAVLDTGDGLAYYRHTGVYGFPAEADSRAIVDRGLKKSTATPAQATGDAIAPLPDPAAQPATTSATGR